MTLARAAVSNAPAMTCGNCGRQNPPGALYCLDCGQKLREATAQGAIQNPAAGPFSIPGTTPSIDVAPQSPPRPAPLVCPRCGTLTDRSAIYCGVCGMAAAEMLAGQAPYAAPVPTPSAPMAAPTAAATPAVARAASAESRPDTRTDNFGAVASGVTPQIVTILKDGSEGPVYRLTNAVTDIGRYEGNVTLPDDPYLSPRHARIQRRGDRYYLRDLGSVNGIFQRIREPVELHHGDVVLVGQQVLRIEVLADAEVSLGPVMHYGVMLFGTPEQPRTARLVQLTSEGVPRDIFHLYRDETVVGRESGDVVFTDDVFLSRRHVAFRLDRAQRRVIVRDLGSSNGTLVLFRGEREIADGDIFRIGHHLFRFDASPRMSAAAPGAPGAQPR